MPLLTGYLKRKKKKGKGDVKSRVERRSGEMEKQLGKVKKKRRNPSYLSPRRHHTKRLDEVFE